MSSKKASPAASAKSGSNAKSSTPQAADAPAARAKAAKSTKPSASEVAAAAATAAAALAAAVPQAVALSKLYIDPLNTRRTEPDPKGITQLAAMIRASGLQPLQNLVGRLGEDGRVGIVAGGRRLRAMTLLRDAGEVPADHPLQVRIVSDDAAVAVSIAENVREPLAEGDLIVAFGALLDQGVAHEVIARDFGVSAAYVRQRARLAGMHPQLLAELSGGGIDIEQLRVLSIEADPQAQLACWTAAKANHQTHVNSLRQRLFADGVSSTSLAATYVGMQAYRAAGGQVAEDLFATSDDPVKLLDPALLARLCDERMREQASKMLGDAQPAWVATTMAQIYAVPDTYIHAPTVAAARTPAALAAHQHAQQAVAEAAGKLRAAVVAAVEAGETLLDEGEGDIDEILAESDDPVAFAELMIDYVADNRVQGYGLPEAAEQYTAAARVFAEAEARLTRRAPHPLCAGQAGALVALDRVDGVKVLWPLLIKADSAPLLKAIRMAERAEQTAASASGDGTQTAAPQPQADRLSGTVEHDLNVHLRNGMRAALIESPEAAMRLMAARLMRGALGVHTWERSCLGVVVNLDLKRASLSAGAGGAHACEVFERESERWNALFDRDSVSKPGVIEQWFLNAPMTEVMAAMAFAAARGVQSDVLRGDRPGVDVAAIQSAIGFDMRRAWTTTAEFFKSVPKAVAVGAVRDTKGEEAARAAEKLAKGPAIAAAVEAIAGKDWLPRALRPQPPSEAAHAADGGEGDDADGGEADDASDEGMEGEAAVAVDEAVASDDAEAGASAQTAEA